MRRVKRMYALSSYSSCSSPPSLLFISERRNRARQRADAAKQAVIATAEAEARASAREKHSDAGERGRGDAAISGVPGAGSRAAAAAAEDLQGRRDGDDDDDDDDDDGANDDAEEEEQQEGEDEVGEFSFAFKYALYSALLWDADGHLRCDMCPCSHPPQVAGH